MAAAASLVAARGQWAGLKMGVKGGQGVLPVWPISERLPKTRTRYCRSSHHEDAGRAMATLVAGSLGVADHPGVFTRAMFIGG